MDNTSHQWEEGWDGHEKAQLLRMAALTFHEKLKWLEDAQNWVDSLRHMGDAGTHTDKVAIF